MHADARVAAVAGAQDGVISREQLIAAGLTQRQIGLRVGRGLLLRRHPRVYLVAGAALTFRARVRAALLECGPTAFASHRTSAALWQIRRHPGQDVEVTVIAGNCGRPDGVLVHRARSISTRELRVRDGIRCSAPARVICELAAVADRETVEYAIQEAAARRLLTPGELAAARTRWGRRAGAAMLSSILQAEAGGGLTRSKAERLLVSLIERAGLPRPEKNVQINGHRVDAVWRDQRLIVEIDGLRTHGTAVAFAADRAMDAELTAAGWRVLRFTAIQLQEQPLLVISRIAQALAARS